MSTTVGGGAIGGVPVDPTIRPTKLSYVMTEDMSTFFNTDEFAIEASFEPKGKSSFFINGFFDRSPSIPEIFSGRQSIAPRFRTPSAPLLRDARKDDLLVIGDEAYYIIGLKHDGFGTTVFELSLDPDEAEQ